MKSKALFALLLAALLLPGCSVFTKSGRQQAAYARYVRKSSVARVRQQRLFHSNKPMMPVTEPVESTSSSGPVSMSSGEGG